MKRIFASPSERAIIDAHCSMRDIAPEIRLTAPGVVDLY